MTNSNPPSEFFNGIIFNPSFYDTTITNQNNTWVGTNTFTALTAQITTFIEPPNMSGLNIEVNTIPDISLSGNVCLLDAVQTLSNKTLTLTTFTEPPNMSGLNIEVNTIPDSSLSGNVVLLDATQTLTHKTIDFSTIEYCDIIAGTLGSATINLPVVNYGSFTQPTFRDVMIFYDTFENFTGTLDCNNGNFNVTNNIQSFTVTVTDTVTAGVLVSAPYLSGSLNITSPNITSGDAINGYTTINGNSLSTTNLTVTTNPLIKNQYINSCSILRVGNFTVSTPYNELYPLSPTANQTITLPTASFALLGIRFRFRRVGGTSTVAINSASSNIYQNTGFTATNVLIASGNFNVVVTCSYITSTTYGWVI
jgi:hypothetical protein